MKIIKSTDGQHLGHDIETVNIGDTVNLVGFLFEVQLIKTLENGNILLANPNYQLELED